MKMIRCINTKTGEERMIEEPLTKNAIGMKLGNWEIADNQINPEEFLEKQKALKAQEQTSLEEARKIYQEVFGKPAHHSSTATTIMAKVAERKAALEAQPPAPTEPQVAPEASNQ